MSIAQKVQLQQDNYSLNFATIMLTDVIVLAAEEDRSLLQRCKYKDKIVLC